MLADYFESLFSISFQIIEVSYYLNLGQTRGMMLTLKLLKGLPKKEK